GDGRVERNAPDDGVSALDVLGKPAPHEGEGAGIGRLGFAARRLSGGEGAIDGVRWHVPLAGRFVATAAWRCAVATLSQRVVARTGAAHKMRLQGRAGFTGEEDACRHLAGAGRVMVRSRRLELPRVAPQRPQRCASTNS